MKTKRHTPTIAVLLFILFTWNNTANATTYYRTKTSFFLNTLSLRFDFSDNPVGIYFAQIKTDNGVVTKKLIINK